MNFPSEIPTEQVKCSVGFFFSASDLDTPPHNHHDQFRAKHRFFISGAFDCHIDNRMNQSQYQFQNEPIISLDALSEDLDQSLIT